MAGDLAALEWLRNRDAPREFGGFAVLIADSALASDGFARADATSIRRRKDIWADARRNWQIDWSRTAKQEYLTFISIILVLISPDNAVCHMHDNEEMLFHKACRKR